MLKGIMSESLHINGIMSKEFSAIRCLDFNGSTDYVDCGNDPSLNNPKKIEVWFKTTQRTTHLIVTKCLGLGNSQNGWAFFIEEKKLLLRVMDPGEATHKQIISTSDVNDDIWHHGKLTIDSVGIAHLFVDDVEEKSGDISAYNISNDYALVIGSRSALGYYFNGSICGVGIHNQDGLVAEWLMREQQGNIIHDTSVNSNHGTIYGADWHEEKFNTPLRGIMSNSSAISGIMTAEYI